MIAFKNILPLFFITLILFSSAIASTKYEVIVAPNDQKEFSPSFITISPGDTVEWILDPNATSDEYNVVQVIDKESCFPLQAIPQNPDDHTQYTIESNYLTTGGKYSFTFNEPGEYYYISYRYCDQEGMKGEILVQNNQPLPTTSTLPPTSTSVPTGSTSQQPSPSTTTLIPSPTTTINPSTQSTNAAQTTTTKSPPSTTSPSSISSTTTTSTQSPHPTVSVVGVSPTSSGTWQFTPSSITLEPNSLVQWVRAPAPSSLPICHIVQVADPTSCTPVNGGFSSPMDNQNEGSTFSWTFPTAGTYYFVCREFCDTSNNPSSSKAPAPRGEIHVVSAQTKTPIITSPDSSDDSGMSKNDKLAIALGTVIGGICGGILLFTCYYCCVKRRKQKQTMMAAGTSSREGSPGSETRPIYALHQDDEVIRQMPAPLRYV